MSSRHVFGMERAEAAPKPQPVGEPMSDEMAALAAFLKAELVGFIDIEVSAKLAPMRETMAQIEMRLTSLESKFDGPAPPTMPPPPAATD